MTRFLSTFTAACLTLAFVAQVTAQETKTAEDRETKNVEERKTKTAEERKKERKLNRVSKTAEPLEGFEPVEMFKAMEDGSIEVRIVTKDASQANVFVENKSDKPLSIKMPAAFAAVPVMKQGGLGGNFGGGGGNFGGGGFGGQGGGGFGGGNQGVGGGFGGGGGGFGGGGFGGGGFGGGGFGGGGGIGGPGGAFNIPPGKKGKVEVGTVCLEHGKKDPRPQMKYQIIPIGKFTDKPEVAETLKMLANGEINQKVAQAAAWNIMDGMTWQQLAVKNRVEYSNGYFERFFHPQHLRTASRVVVAARQRVEAAEKSEQTTHVSPGEKLSKENRGGE